MRISLSILLILFETQQAVKDSRLPCPSSMQKTRVRLVKSASWGTSKANHVTRQNSQAKNTASESSRKRMAAHKRAAHASKLALNPGCFFTQAKRTAYSKPHLIYRKQESSEMWRKTTPRCCREDGREFQRRELVKTGEIVRVMTYFGQGKRQPLLGSHENFISLLIHVRISWNLDSR